MDIWTKVCVPLFLNLVGLGGFLKAQFFSQGILWEPLSPAGGTNQSAADCDSRKTVSDVFQLATGVSWIYLSRVVAFHICMHTSHAYTHSRALAVCFTLSWDQSGLAVWQPLGCYTSPKPHSKCLCLCSSSLPFLFQLQNVCSWVVLMLKPNLRYWSASCLVLLFPFRTGFRLKQWRYQ